MRAHAWRVLSALIIAASVQLNFRSRPVYQQGDHLVNTFFYLRAIFAYHYFRV